MKKIFPALVCAFLCFFILAFFLPIWSAKLATMFGTLPTDFIVLDRLALMTPSLKLPLFIALVTGLCIGGFMWFDKAVQHQTYRASPWMIVTGGILLAYILFFLQTGEVWVIDGVLQQAKDQLTPMFLSEFQGKNPEVLTPLYWFFSFTGKILWSLGALLILWLGALGLGSWAKNFFASYPPALRIAFHTGLGLIILMGGAFLAGATGVLSMSLAGVSLFFPFLCAGVCLSFFRMRDVLSPIFRPARVEATTQHRLLHIGCTVGLIATVVATLIHLMRPIPIGWDDIGVYMNIPSLLADYGHLISGFGPYNFGLITQLGFTVFGDTSIAMMFTFFGGAMALVAIYGTVAYVGRGKLPSFMPLLLTTVFAMTPFVLFQLGEDMKVDLPLLYFFLLTGVLLFDWLRQKEKRTWTHAAFLGVFLGIALGVKLTSLLFVGIVVTILGFVAGGAYLFGAGVAFFLALLLQFRVFALGGLVMEDSQILLFTIIAILVGALLTLIAFFQKKVHVDLYMKMMGICGLAVALILPWFVFHYTSSCSAQGCGGLSSQTLVFGNSMNPQPPQLDAALLTQTGTVLPSDQQAANAEVVKAIAQEGGANTEELGRYAGYGDGILHYLTIPFDTIFTLNVIGDYVVSGWVYVFLFILFFLSLLFGNERESKERLVAHVATYVVLVSGMVALSYFKVAVEGPLWVSLLLPIGVVALLGYVIVRSTLHTAEKVGATALLLYVLLWTYTASGVLWYGIGGFPLFIALISGMFVYIYAKFPKVVMLVSAAILVFWIVPMMFYLFSKSNTSSLFVTAKETEGKVEAVVDSIPLRSFDQRNFTMYKMGLMGPDLTFSLYNRDYYAVANMLNVDPEPKIYRIGTMIPYFVHKNQTRIFSDNQLDHFMTLYMPHKNKAAVVASLKKAGYDYIVYDTATSTIDTTKGKTLTQKNELFLEFTKDNPGLVPMKEASSLILWKLQ